ncbi:hypothetical protein D3C72_2525240 [compost metagenome]
MMGWVVREKSVRIGMNFRFSASRTSRWTANRSSLRCSVPCEQVTPRKPSVHW